MVKTRGKFSCDKISQVKWNTALRIFTFSAVCSDDTSENERFHKYTPSGTIEIWVDNPNVTFELGKNYYVDFSEAS